jgi:hypothetical protein
MFYYENVIREKILQIRKMFLEIKEIDQVSILLKKKI